MKLHSLRVQTAKGDRMATVDVDTAGNKIQTFWWRASEKSVWEKTGTFEYTKDEWLQQSLDIYKAEDRLKEMWGEENEERV